MVRALREIDQGYKHDRPSENSIDEIYAFFQNCYHLKDWLKNDRGLPRNVQKSVESFVNRTRSLRVCGDLAISLKHLERRSNKSHEDPAFGSKTYSYSVADSSLSIKSRITTRTGQEDVFALATQCVKDWDLFIRKWKL
jgi:hypothetical protein